MLGHVVRPVEGNHGQPGHRRRVDHVSGAPRHEVGYERAHSVDHAPNVHVEDPSPSVEVHLPERVSSDRNTGVVAHDMDVAEGLERTLREPLDVVRAGDIGAYPDRAHSDRRDVVDRRSQSILLHVGKRDVEAGTSEFEGERAPDSARGPRDDCALTRAELHDGKVATLRTRQGGCSSVCPRS